MTLRNRALVPLALLSVASAGGCAPAGNPPASTAAVITASPTPTAAAVSGTTEPMAVAPDGSVRVTVTSDSVRFDPEEISVRSGPVTFFIVNDNAGVSGGQSHQLSIGDEVGGRSLAASAPVAPGQSAAFTVTGLEPGDYAFWCFIHEHYTFGMVGTLTVTQ